MRSWVKAGNTERRLFAAIAELFVDNARLLDFLFDPEKPKLSAAPDELLAATRGLCSSDFLKVRVALDLWSGSGSVFVHELVDADPAVYQQILNAMAKMAS